MAIVNAARTAEHITTWIKDYATKAGIKTLVLGLSGGVDSALVALLCKRTGIPVFAVNMPCHSSDSAYQRAKEFAEDYDIRMVRIDLSSAHEKISSQDLGGLREVVTLEQSNSADSALRSCLRSPILSFIAHATDGLIVGTGNRSEDNLIRYFQKFGDGCVDIAPITDLFKSEVYELFVYLAKLQAPNKEEKSIGILLNTTNYSGDVSGIRNSALRILYAKPTADLKGPDSGQEDEKDLGLTYDEIEWADRENERTCGRPHWCDEGIIVSLLDPVKNQAWHGYTARQRTVIAKIHGLEKISRHKINIIPSCRLRYDEGLVR
jgi:NAD+ synthase